MPYKDPEKSREKQRRYSARHKDAIAERRRKKRETHGDEIRADMRRRYARDPAKYRDAFLRRRYGITQVDFDRMFFEQDGRCAVCDLADFPGPGNKPHVDHNHKTGKVRALVCVRCNVLLGMAQEQPERFHAALRYLEKHKVDMRNLTGYIQLT